MWNSQNTFETRKRSFASVFSICMTVPLSPLKTWNLSICDVIYVSDQYFQCQDLLKNILKPCNFFRFFFLDALILDIAIWISQKPCQSPCSISFLVFSKGFCSSVAKFNFFNKHLSCTLGTIITLNCITNWNLVHLLKMFLDTETGYSFWIQKLSLDLG